MKTLIQKMIGLLFLIYAGNEETRAPKMTKNPYEYRPDSCSQELGLFNQHSNAWEQAFSGLEQEVFDLDD
jgi:hypothetical protein